MVWEGEGRFSSVRSLLSASPALADTELTQTEESNQQDGEERKDDLIAV